MSRPTDRLAIFIVVPVFNETTVLPNVVDALLSFGYHIVIVDDGSATKAGAVLNRRPVYVVRHKINLGQGAAIQTGMEFALAQGADIIVTFDGDGQHSAADIERLIQPLKNAAADVALGSRFLQHSAAVPLQRRLLLQTARIINFLFTGLLLTDAHNGLRAVTNEAAQKIKLQENRMAHATEILWIIRKHKLRFIEVPVKISYTKYSKAKGQKLPDAFRILFDLLLNKVFK